MTIAMILCWWIKKNTKHVDIQLKQNKTETTDVFELETAVVTLFSLSTNFEEVIQTKNYTEW